MLCGVLQRLTASCTEPSSWLLCAAAVDETVDNVDSDKDITKDKASDDLFACQMSKMGLTMF